MQIPNRLKIIGDFVRDGAYVADIGADHGLLELYLILKNIDCHILAIENKKGPLTALHQTAGCLKNVTISHSDGMNRVSEEYDTVILAGMGGENIINILSKDLTKLNNVKHVIVDAHSDIPKVREFLIKQGFEIEKEKIVFEGNIYYVIISFIRNSNKKNYTKEEIDFGFNLFLDPLFNDYKNYVIRKQKNILIDLDKLAIKTKKYEEITNEIRRLEKYGQN